MVGFYAETIFSSGKNRLGWISKRGDKYMRMLLIHGARATLNATKNKEDGRSCWVKSLATRRNKNIATVALANKNARIAWSILSRDESYRKVVQRLPCSDSKSCLAKGSTGSCVAS